jgi:hypothetical protein
MELRAKGLAQVAGDHVLNVIKLTDDIAQAKLTRS